ncbi:hypothetical protein [Luteimonas aquatica]|uniref:hypothetical protein n=1 Tax=Luteimonas aquatica TaxID=450364 RepID=UPI001F57CC12|nr:hypothetical protein [Luteimonas aquatica]
MAAIGMPPVVLAPTFKALLKEAQFTQEMLGAGATQIRKANYASKGLYFQAFTSLATGLERIGKLCLLLDCYLSSGRFPDDDYLRTEIGHKLKLLYARSQNVIARHSIEIEYKQDLSDPILQAIIQVLHDFALGDRYSNIDMVIRNPRSSDPVIAWYKTVDIPLYESMVTDAKKQKIAHNAAAVAALIGQHSMVLHTSEIGEEITDIEQASQRTGMFEAVAPHRQLRVLQIIRYWVELLRALQWKVYFRNGGDIPCFGEIFAIFNNDDSYFRTRKTWISP